jgi:predicted nucleotidyltransferase
VTRDQLVERLCVVLKERDEVEFAVLFGSAATRALERARDVDVAVSFRSPRSWLERAELARLLERALAPDSQREVDLVDLAEASTMLRFQVLRAGIPIVVRDRRAWLQYQARVPIEHADLRPYFDRQADGLRRALERTSPWSK